MLWNSLHIEYMTLLQEIEVMKYILQFWKSDALNAFWNHNCCRSKTAQARQTDEDIIMPNFAQVLW